MADLSKNQAILNLKRGFQNIKTALEEGNFRLFVKQAVTILIALFLVRWCIGKFNQKIAKNHEQIASIEMQQRSEKEYVANKNLLLALEPLFPDVSEKNSWLTSQVLNLFKEASLPPQLSGKPTEDNSNPTFVVNSVVVSTNATYMTLGKLLERVENKSDFLRVSEVQLTKDTNTQNIGNNKISLRFNTVFPKQKIGRNLFPNYDELVKQQKTEQGGK